MATLPEPAPAQKNHSEQLRALIVDAIKKAGGQISFTQYMSMALYQPGLGYYAAGAQKFGASGDFITSPEVSPLFAQCLARQVRQVMLELEQSVLIEFGAGSGLLAADLLLELDALESMPAAYWIVEVSAELQQRQQATIAEKCGSLADKVNWLQQLPKEPVQGVVIANEVLDAMPLTCFEKQQGELIELGVCYEQQALHWSAMVPGATLQASVADIETSIGQSLPQNYRSEYNPSMQPWLNSLGGLLSKGLVLLIDYGYDAGQYYSAERAMGTLMCYYQHRAHDDVFFYPGLQDITAFVDFTAVAEAALKAEFDVLGYTTQAQFLLASGLPQIFETKMAQLAEEDVAGQIKISQQVKTLTLPSEMGERFKVMALGRDIEPGLIGFSLADFRNRL